MKNFVLFLTLGIYAATLSAETLSPYAGEDSRNIKSLSSDRIAGLLEGKGLGYGKVAELNGFPGPAHVLELADQLAISEDQKSKTLAIFNAMQSQAKKLGAQLVEAERQLDELFTSGEISAAVVSSRLEDIGALEGQLRAAHVNAHLEQKALLTKHQVHRYNQLRGYVSGAHQISPDHHHH
jgi:Spy/CpxP family protein refolding chaperone